MGKGNNQLTEGGQQPNTTKGANGASTRTTQSTTEPRGTTEETKSPRVVMVDLPDPEGDKEETKKKRGRPAGTTGTKKTSTKSTPKKSDPSQMHFLLMTVSGLMASREGMGIWALTPEESQQLAIAIQSVMDKHEGVALVSDQYAEYVTLAIVSFSIFVPKYLMWKATQPKKPKQEKKVSYGIQPVPNVQQKPAGTPATNGKTTTPTNLNPNANTGPAPNVSTFGGNLHDLVPVLV